MENKVTIAILASGTGSNAKALLEKAAQLNQVEVACVITDRAKAGVIEVADVAGVECKVITSKNCGGDRARQEQMVTDYLKQKKVDWVFLAGYMKVLGSNFLAAFKDEALGVNRVVNIHPSLLPSFKGANGYKDAFEYGVALSGVTVHLVSEELDDGPIIAQASFTRGVDDSLSDFMANGLKLEHQLYPDVMEKLLTSKFKVHRTGDARLRVVLEG